MIGKITLATIVFFTLMNCKSQKINSLKSAAVEENTSKQTENTIKLSQGESLFIKEAQMNVTFKGIKNDSRCPEGVNCIWAGAATAIVEVMSTTSRPELLEISTITDTGKSLANTQSAFGMNLSLMSLTPFPTQKIGKNQLEGKYQIVLKIAEGKPVPTIKTPQATTK